MCLAGLIRSPASQRAAKLLDTVLPIGLRDSRFLLLLQQLHLLWRDVLAIEQHKTARRHHIVAIHPLPILLMKPQSRPGVGMVRIQFENPIEMLATFVAKLVLATP